MTTPGNNNNSKLSFIERLNELISDVITYLKDLVNLSEDMADPMQSIRDIEKSVVFRGTNIWILMFSILVASLGLNVNSPAVVIGAMLISPLLGPIMGVGLGIGINSFDLIKKSLVNLLVMVSISIITSAIYFMISPLKEVQSEILARTQPAIWDVGIAFFGGLAGIVAFSRKEKSNVIPGVAIATALMPPLCTAGYGLGTFQFQYFIGAFYLFFINSVFICLSTFIIVRYLKYPSKEFIDKRREKRVRSYISVVVVLTILPSVYLAYDIVSKSIFDRNAKTFISQYFDFENTRVISPVVDYKSRDSSIIDLTLIGQVIDDDLINFIRAKMPESGLKKTKLIVHQGGTAEADIQKNIMENINQSLKSGIIEDLYVRKEQEVETLRQEKNQLEREFGNYREINEKAKDISKEIEVQYPGIRSFALSKNVKSNLENQQIDTVINALVQIDRTIFKDRQKFEDWIRVRIKEPDIQFIYY